MECKWKCRDRHFYASARPYDETLLFLPRGSSNSTNGGGMVGGGKRTSIINQRRPSFFETFRLQFIKKTFQSSFGIFFVAKAIRDNLFRGEKNLNRSQVSTAQAKNITNKCRPRSAARYKNQFSHQ